MADIDIDPFGEHELRPDKPTGENIPLTPVEGESTWEPECEQETSFGGTSQRTRLVKDYVKDLYKKLTKNLGQTPEAIHLDYFDFRSGELYYRGKNEPLMTEGELKSVGMIADILSKNRFRNLGFDIPNGKLTGQAIMLNKGKEELPSTSDIAKADAIELQEITENASKSTEDLISQIKNDQSQTDDLFDYPLRELLGLDKQLRSIMGSPKVEVAKKVQLEEHIKKEKCKLEEFREYPGVYGDDQLEEIRNRIERFS